MPDDETLMGLDLDLVDETDDDFEPDFEAEVDNGDDPLGDDEEVGDDEDIGANAEEELPERSPKRATTGTDAEFDDEVDPDNLEADLNTILRDRIAAGDDAGDDEVDEPDTGQPAELLGTVTPRRDDEWLCEGCFLLVSKSQLGSRKDPRCPSGEEICPSLDRLGP